MMKKMYLLIMAFAIIFTSSIYANPVNSIELVSFELEQTKSGVEVFFVTASEENCQNFVVEKFFPNKDWIEIVKIDKQGTDLYGTSYEYLDQRMTRGWAHYRISQIDLNGIKHPLNKKSILIDFNNGGFIPEQHKSLDPVCSLKYFQATKRGENINVNWATSSEANVKYFVVERNNAGNVWEENSTVIPKGAVNKLANYVFVDRHFNPDAKLTYRLKMVGFNGQSEIIAEDFIASLDDTTEEDEMALRNSGSPYAEISNLTIDQIGGEIKIAFTAELEQNCKYFTFERSVDRTNWSRSIKVDAVGGISQTDYSEIDFSSASDDTYFRVSAENENGDRKELVTALLNVSSVNDVETFPNPTEGQLFIQSGSDMDDLSIKISDMEGNVLIQRERNFTRSLVLDLTELQKGFYILTISDGKETRTEKILVDR